jgi:hypothetical protein
MFYLIFYIQVVLESAQVARALTVEGVSKVTLTTRVIVPTRHLREDIVQKVCPREKSNDALYVMPGFRGWGLGGHDPTWD